NATVIVPDYQLSLAIGKEGQNARLAARLTGWHVDIKSETEIAQADEFGDQDWAEGEWVVDAKTGEQVWQPAEGGDAISAHEWAEAAEGVAEDAAEGAVEAAVVAEVAAEVGDVEAAEDAADAAEVAAVAAELAAEAAEATGDAALAAEAEVA